MFCEILFRLLLLSLAFSLFRFTNYSLNPIVCSSQREASGVLDEKRRNMACLPFIFFNVETSAESVVIVFGIEADKVIEPTVFPPLLFQGLSTIISILPSIPRGSTERTRCREESDERESKLKYLYPTTEPAVLFIIGLWL